MPSTITRIAPLDRPVFLISLDTELAWGSFDRDGLRRHSGKYAETRRVIQRLLELFRRYEIRATWAVVGHLFLSRCSESGANSHEHVLQPSYGWYPDGWLSHDPFTDAQHDPFFYAPDIVESIIAAWPEQEIASHTFTHAILGDPHCSRDVARSQLLECRRLAERCGRSMRSLVFPRNSIGHVDVLAELGYTSFRGVEKSWHTRFAQPSSLRRACHFTDRLLAITPPCYSAFRLTRFEESSSWVCELPASMFYAPMEGPWKLISVRRRVLQATRGIRKAVSTNGAFHLWFHPFNLATSNELIDGLEEIFATVADEAAAGRLTSWTMADVADHLITRLDGEG